MARMIIHEAKGPVEIKPGTESKWVCMCGLSRNAPFCDGSHKKVREEETGKTYQYLPDGTRKEVKA
ncbi:MAG: CDGSH iron-sulfur domain-containing protein [Candidatus Diapherotrites archaeon]|nr:CDGSH iron-sulfur domain-containing protein [Candidatus Diapherotrites archaeon]